eukprot:TCONS_00048483-protein
MKAITNTILTCIVMYTITSNITHAQDYCVEYTQQRCSVHKDVDPFTQCAQKAFSECQRAQSLLFNRWVGHCKETKIVQVERRERICHTTCIWIRYRVPELKCIK